MVLNSKKEAFAQAIINGIGKVEACIHAGYSEKTARQQATRLMKDAEVVSLVTKLTGSCDTCHNSATADIGRRIIPVHVLWYKAGKPRLAAPEPPEVHH